MPTMTRIAFVLACFGSMARAEDPPRDATPALIPRLFEASGAHSSLAHARPPFELAEFHALRSRLRERHARALGVPLARRPTPVPFRIVATQARRGYELRSITFESRDGVVVPAHLYVPRPADGSAPSRGPAVLCVHGHWSEGKRATPVHARCVFLAMRGFTVLALDAIGAGERAFDGITYHGRQLGYQVLPSGMTLAGLQVLDNRRALDLLAALPEVDPERIGVTGASGGGNQTFHLAILDERVRAAVAVCFFGAYAGYLRGAHCSCETIPAVLTYAEEGALAGVVAPRSLMVIAAREDQGAAFRIEDARRNAATAARFYAAAGAPHAFRLREFDGGHDYSRAMREAMVAFFEHRLAGREPAEAVPEPDLDLLAPGELRVLGDTVLADPRSFVPRIAADLASERIDAFARSGRAWSDSTERAALRLALEHDVFGGFPRGARLVASPSARKAATPLGEFDVTALETEPGVTLDLLVRAPAVADASADDSAKRKTRRTLLVVGALTDDIALALRGEDGESAGENRTVADDIIADDIIIAALAPRGTGTTAWPAASTVRCDDYLLAQGSAVLGRPMLGQWVWDVLRAVEHLERLRPDGVIAVHGDGVFGLVALLAAALDDRIAAASASNSLASWRFDGRFDDRFGLVHFVPGILAVGDVAQIAAGIGTRPLVIGSPRAGSGNVFDDAAVESFVRLARGERAEALPALRVEPAWGAREVVREVVRKVAGRRLHATPESTSSPHGGR